MNAATIPSSPMPLTGRVVDHININKALTNNADGSLKGKSIAKNFEA